MQARRSPVAKKAPGRPKGGDPPKKGAMTYLHPWVIEWMEKNLPRGQSNSEFIAEAVEEKIKRSRR